MRCYVLLAYDDVFACGAQSDRFCQNLSELVRLLKSVRIGQNWLAMKLVDDVAGTLYVSTTAMILRSSSVLLASHWRIHLRRTT